MYILLYKFSGVSTCLFLGEHLFECLCIFALLVCEVLYLRRVRLRAGVFVSQRLFILFLKVNDLIVSQVTSTSPSPLRLRLLSLHDSRLSCLPLPRLPPSPLCQSHCGCVCTCMNSRACVCRRWFLNANAASSVYADGLIHTSMQSYSKCILQHVCNAYF